MFRIAIVDDESYVRMGLKTIAEKEGKYTVVGEADNGASAVQMIMQKQPNAVFLDITIPGLDGMEVLKEIRQRGYSGHVTMLTCHDEFRLVQQALRLGADDYVLKNDLAEESFSQYLKKLSARQTETAEEKRLLEKEQTAQQYKDNFLRNILRMGCTDREMFLRGCENHHIRFKPNGIYILTFSFRHWESLVARYRGSDLHVFFRAVDAIVREVLQNQDEWELLYTSRSVPSPVYLLGRAERPEAGGAAEWHGQKAGFSFRTDAGGRRRDRRIPKRLSAGEIESGL